MPGFQDSSQSASTKKQRSIFNFFTKNGAPAGANSPSSKAERPLSHPVRSRPVAAEPERYSPRAEDGQGSSPTPLERRESLKRDRRTEVDQEQDSEDTAPPVSRRKRIRSSEALIAEDSPGAAQETDKPSKNGKSSKGKVSERTARYLFSDEPAPEDPSDESEGARGRKKKLRDRFLKKLGKPGGFGERGGRHRPAVEGNEDDEDASIEAEEDEDEEDEASHEANGIGKSSRGGRKKGATTKKTKLTPLEMQVIDIKRRHPDTLLVIEVGYKFRFFGEDARTAARELNIVCIPGKFRFDSHPSEEHLNRFASASIPVHRLHVHVKRLVAAGHKVGVVRQLETAALKAAGDNRNAPFERKLTNLYTKATYIDDAEGLDTPAPEKAGKSASTGHLLCIAENKAKGWGSDEKVQVGIVAVQPGTGDIVYDNFEDGFTRSEIETRLLHIAPCEFLVVGELSRASDKLVEHLSGSKANVFGEKLRVQRIERPKTMAAKAYGHVSNFYAGKMSVTDSALDGGQAALLDKILNLPENVLICLSALITHMSEYGLEHVFDLTKYFQSFSARSHMLLNGTTLTSLEIYQNQTDHTQRGSLFWTLDRTSTRFGQRLLRKWVGRPLLDKTHLEERTSAVEELKQGTGSASVVKLKEMLSKIRIDLEKSLIRVYYGKCTRPELLTLLQTLQGAGMEFSSVGPSSNTAFKNSLLSSAVEALPVILEDVNVYLDKINLQAAKDDDKYSFFRENEETEAIEEHKLGIAAVEHELDEHRVTAAEKVRKKKVEYVTSAGIEYLIEVENTWLKNVPASWIKVSGTKKLSRFHTPEAVRLIKERDQHKESLAAACDAAFADLLTRISTKYQAFRDCVVALATLDCLLSLASVAAQPGYVKPEFTDDTCILVRNGRHPMVERLLLDAYVPNDVDLRGAAVATARADGQNGDENVISGSGGGGGTRALLITGPNMGGKSSYVRQVALIAIMGQIGSYVPADSAQLGMLDAVFTRMGAFDNMMVGESTFMVELSETSDILKQASPRSLVILDELGRGTSTHDGVAIARAVLDHVVRSVGCLTLFITHYQSLAAAAKTFPGRELRNVHMKFTESADDRGGEEITFLYEVGEGAAHRSYGLNVAKLAGVPGSVLESAAVKSRELEESGRQKKMSNVCRTLALSLEQNDPALLGPLASSIEEL